VAACPRAMDHDEYLCRHVLPPAAPGHPVVDVPPTLRDRFHANHRADRFIPRDYAQKEMRSTGVHVLAAAKGMGKSTCLRALCTDLPLCLFVTFSQSLASQVCVELREEPSLDVYHYRDDASVVRAGGEGTTPAVAARAQMVRNNTPPAAKVLVVVINSLMKVGMDLMREDGEKPASGELPPGLCFDGIVLDEFESDLTNVSPDGLVTHGRL